MKFLTIDDFNLKDKTVLIRLGLDSPNDPQKHIIDNNRLDECAEALRELSEMGSKVVGFGHQGRPGNKDFNTTEQHAHLISKKIHKKIQYSDILFGKEVDKKIQALKPGDILLLQNTRFSSEEIIEIEPEEHAKSFFVESLMPLIDFYINDAFSNSHRQHASMIGFTKIPNIAGRFVTQEVHGILKASKEAKRPYVMILGGAKIDDYFGLVEKFLKEERVDKILVGGFMADLGLLARGFSLGGEEKKLLKIDSLTESAPMKLLETAKRFFEGYPDKFEIPDDVALDVNGKRKEILVKDLPNDNMIVDIGEKTINKYCDIIASAGTVYLKGPMGFYEKEPFKKGSEKIIQAVARSKAYSLVGGGNTASVVDQFSDKKKFSHVSLAGGATIKLMEKHTLVALESLETSYGKFKKSITNKINSRA